MTPEQFEGWRAALDMVGVDDQWKQTQVVCQEIHRIALAHAGSKEDPPELHAFNPNLFTLTDRPQPEKRTSKYLTNEEARAAAKRRAGL